MDLNVALELFNICNRLELEDKNLKKKYRKLMMKYHPDNNGGDTDKAAELSLAYEKLKRYNEYIRVCEVIQSLENKKLDTVCISFRDMLDIINKKKVTVDSREITYQSLDELNVIMEITFRVKVNNTLKTYNTFEVYDKYKQEYDVHCLMEVNDLNKPLNIEVLDLKDDIISFTMNGQSLKYRTKISNSMYFNILFEKKLVTDENTENSD